MNYHTQKRIFDFCFSLLGLILLSPLFVMTSLIVLISSGWPIFYTQKRVGLKGKLFNIFKFRTMRSLGPGQNSSLITIGEDKRITRIGSILRKFKIDELPQLFNVFKGEMSFVGPRPEVPKYVDLYTPEQKRILNYKPGITDWASIEFRNESEILSTFTNPEKAYIESIIPKKIELNYIYLKNQSFKNDIKVIIKTIISMTR